MGIFDMFGDKKGTGVVGEDDFIPPEILGQSAISLRDVVAPSAIQVTSRHISLGNKFARSFSVVSYPRFLNEGWFSPIINLSKEFDIAIFVHPMDSKDVLRKFRRKVAQVESQIIERESKGMVRDPNLIPRIRTLKNFVSTYSRRLSECLRSVCILLFTVRQ